jgi:stage II sporulation protein P
LRKNDSPLRKRNLYWLIFLLAVVIALLFLIPTRGRENFPQSEIPVFLDFSGESGQANPAYYPEGELESGQSFVLRDESGGALDETSIMVYADDEFILENNDMYRVVSVDWEGRAAVCEKTGRAELPYLEAWDQPPVTKGNYVPKIGIYMTHTDESYVPTEGTASKTGRGGILKVGSRFAEILKSKGLDAVLSQNKHDPHDGNAYSRSRRTAVQLLKSNPDVLFDVHRDGVPDPGFYATTLDGEKGTKIRLVVGKQNPAMASNLEFAKQIKSYYDKHEPGLIKGIYMAKGNYNQDIGPRVLLLEVGTHTNTREEAEKGIEVFAGGLPQFLGAGARNGGQGQKTPLNTNKGIQTAILWLVGAAAVGGAAFIWISKGAGGGSGRSS